MLIMSLLHIKKVKNEIATENDLQNKLVFNNNLFLKT